MANASTGCGRIKLRSGASTSWGVRRGRLAVADLGLRRRAARHISPSTIKQLGNAPLGVKSVLILGESRRNVDEFVGRSRIVREPIIEATVTDRAEDGEDAKELKEINQLPKRAVPMVATMLSAAPPLPHMRMLTSVHAESENQGIAGRVK